MDQTSHPRYSIIICAYNVELYLRECLDSVFAQDSPSSYEILLIDNGSTDGTGTICTEYAAKYPCIRLTRLKENPGGAAPTTNQVLPTARGTYILIPDSDDLWKPNLLSSLDPLTEDSPDMVVFCNEEFNETGTLGTSQYPQSLVPQGESGQDWLEQLLTKKQFPPSTCWSVCTKRSFIEAHQLYLITDWRLGADIEWIYRSLKLAESVRGTNQILYRYRLRADSVSHSVTPEFYLQGMAASAETFKKFPDYLLQADNFCWYAARIARLGGIEQERACIAYVQENWDIIEHVQRGKMKIARMLLRIFGIHNGSQIWLWGCRLWYRIAGKTKLMKAMELY